MKMTDKVEVVFENIKWDTINGNVPDALVLHIPCKFFCEPVPGKPDECQTIGGNDDIRDIFSAYLQDEMGYAPVSFEYDIVFK